jgi:hypothetical protein
MIGGLDKDVVRKHFDSGVGGLLAVDGVAATCSGARQLLNLDNIGAEKVRHIDQEGFALGVLRFDFERFEVGIGEGALNGASDGLFGVGIEAQVGHDQQNLLVPTDKLEHEVVHWGACCQEEGGHAFTDGCLQEVEAVELFLPNRHIEGILARFLLAVQGEQPLHLLEIFDYLVDGLFFLFLVGLVGLFGLVGLVGLFGFVGLGRLFFSGLLVFWLGFWFRCGRRADFFPFRQGGAFDALDFELPLCWGASTRCAEAHPFDLHGGIHYIPRTHLHQQFRCGAEFGVILSGVGAGDTRYADAFPLFEAFERVLGSAW